MNALWFWEDNLSPIIWDRWFPGGKRTIYSNAWMNHLIRRVNVGYEVVQ